MRLPRFGRRVLPTEAEVAVVGSGLPAAAVALELARRGRRVVALGAAEEAGASHALGLVACGPGRPYATVVRALGREAARSLWTAGRENHARLRALIRQTGQGCGFRVRGGFLLSQDRAEAESLAESEDLLRDDGFPGEFLDHYMLETRFDVSSFTAAYWAAEEAEVDARLVVRVTAEAARTAGASWRREPVRAVEIDPSGATLRTDGGPMRSKRVVIAGDGPVVDALRGMRERLHALVAEGRRFTPPPGARLPSGARTADGRFAWQEDAGGTTVTAVRVDVPSGADAAPTLDDLLARLHAAPGSGHGWSEPVERTADGLPLVGLWPDSPLAVACGFGSLATSLAFAAASWIAEALVAAKDPTPGPLRAARSLDCRG